MGDIHFDDGTPWLVRSDSPFTKRSGDMVYNSWLD
jgi:hypothetical protein